MNAWLCFFYHYGIGGLLFAGGILLAIRSGALRPTAPGDRWIVPALLAGLLIFLSLHAFWIGAALSQ